MKGVVFVRWGTREDGGKCIHVLDWGQLEQVSWATFTSETLACISAVDQLIVLASLLQRMAEDVVSLDQAVKMTDARGNVYETGVNIDAMFVLSAFEPVSLWQPSEKSF